MRQQTNLLSSKQIKTSGSSKTKPRHRFAAPDALETIALCVRTIDEMILPELSGGATLPVVIAEKKLYIRELPSYFGLASKDQTQGRPCVRRAGKTRGQWVREQYFGFAIMLRGEADILLSRKVVTLHERNLVVVHPKSWGAKGTTSHWEREHVEQAACDIGWFFISSFGMMIHFCWSRGSEHFTSSNIFVPDSTFLSTAELLIDELSEEGSPIAARQIISLIFERAHRKLLKGRAYPGEGESAQTLPASTRSTAERARRYIDANLSEHLTMASVARAVFVSRSSLALAFQKEMNETFAQYLTRRRLDRAKQLLTTTTLPVSGVAFYIGFSRVQYFNEWFRKHSGCSPLQYRNSG